MPAAHELPLFFFNDTATTEIYTLSLHDALPISAQDGVPQRRVPRARPGVPVTGRGLGTRRRRSEEHTSELQSLRHLVSPLLLGKKRSTPLALSSTHAEPI